MTGRVTIIVAQDQGGGIGNNGGLPWPRIKEDMKFFKDETTDHVVIMGRKTFDTLPKPLPNRTNIVLTRDPEWSKDGCDVCHDLKDALDAYEDSEIFIIGGAEIYELALPYADRILLTRVFGAFDADTFWRFNAEEWVLDSSRQVRRDDDTLVCTFESYSRPKFPEPEVTEPTAS